MKKIVKKIFITVTLLTFSVSGVAFATPDTVSNRNIDYQIVKGIELEIVSYSENGNEYTLVDVAKPENPGEYTKEEKEALNTYALMRQNELKAFQVTPYYDGGTKNFYLNDIDNGSDLRLYVEGQWYKNNMNSTLQINPGRVLQGYNVMAGNDRVIQFEEIATFKVIKPTGWSVSAGGSFSITTSGNEKTARFKTPEMRGQTLVEFKNTVAITSVGGAFSYGHEGTYEVIMFAGVDGKFTNLNDSDSWYM